MNASDPGAVHGRAGALVRASDTPWFGSWTREPHVTDPRRERID